MSVEISVVVPSHDRPLRLRWLLNALEEQTLERDLWEVVVGHDSAGDETERLLVEHPLARGGMLRRVRLAPGSAPPGANRNAAWREARGQVIAFTDDDCRPPADWLERALAAARRHPGAVIQGTTRPDPEESVMKHAPHWRSQNITPPVWFAQACNIVYPRALLERLGGFDEEMHTGEDADLAARARASGAGYLAAPEMLTYHAIDALSLWRRLRSLTRWEDQPLLVKRHPELREAFPLWVFWKRTHVWLPFALAGAVLERRNPLWAALAVPWLLHATPHHAESPRGRIRSLLELPGRAAIDLTEIAVLARGSIKHRSFFV